MNLKIATWNVNSLRVRLPQVLAWLLAHKPDILALQETKTPDADFPHAEIRQAGYEVIFSGQKAYNGVAILSRIQGENPLMDFPGFVDPQRRVLALTLGDVRIINLYIPNGESTTSEKFNYKLSWLDRLQNFLAKEIESHPKTLILGDFNIAPEDQDVHAPEIWVGRIMCSDPERSAFQNLIQMGFQDCFRLHTQEEKSFSWWDYRLNSFKRNLGLRIDHILTTKPLSAQCKSCYIDKTPRANERPSDHTPVIAEFQA